MTFCKSKRISTTAIDVAEEKTAFYTFDVSHDSIKKQTVFKLTNVMLANTKIKYQPDQAKAKEASYLKLQITDQGDKLITGYVEHPLYKRLEVFSESGQIESNLISLPKAQFVLRVPYFSDYKKIKIVEVINFKESPTVILKHEK